MIVHEDRGGWSEGRLASRSQVELRQDPSGILLRGGGLSARSEHAGGNSSVDDQYASRDVAAGVAGQEQRRRRELEGLPHRPRAVRAQRVLSVPA